MLQREPEVVHLQSGHGLGDAALIHASANSVVGIDYSVAEVGAGQRCATEIDVACRYVAATVPEVPLVNGSADLVYTGIVGTILGRPADAARSAEAEAREP